MRLNIRMLVVVLNLLVAYIKKRKKTLFFSDPCICFYLSPSGDNLVISEEQFTFLPLIPPEVIYFFNNNLF